MRKITGLWFAGNGGSPHFVSENRATFIHERLDEALNIVSGLQQGVRTESDEYKEWSAEAEDCVRDICAAILGKAVEFKEELPYPGEWKL